MAELSFAYEQYICDGHNPAGYHTPDNVYQVLFTDGGTINATSCNTDLGAFDSRTFGAPYNVAMDENTTHMRLTYLPRINLFVHWESDGRHRLALMFLKQDTSKYLQDGRITFREDDPGASLQLTLHNPEQTFAAEDHASFGPGTMASVWFGLGDSSRYQIGEFYFDRVVMGRTDPYVRIDARNAIGKLLKDQSFDEQHTRMSWSTNTFFGGILDDAGLTQYKIQDISFPNAYNFPRDKSYYDGIAEALQAMINWRIRENPNGEVIIGHRTDFDEFTESIFTFTRDEDCFSREVVRDDQEVYSRVCIWYEDGETTEYIYRDVDFLSGWNMPTQKTIYIELPDGMETSDAEAIADDIAARFGLVGQLETFVGRFTPHLQPGDEARIIEPGKSARTIGVVTQVEHSFGRGGFYTQFTVDSGGKLGKPMIKNYMEQVVRKAMQGKGEYTGMGG